MIATLPVFETGPMMMETKKGCGVDNASQEDSTGRKEELDAQEVHGSRRRVYLD
jgi:hypothetical protein